MPITDWPKGEQPRERLIEVGAENLTNAELLAILLRTGQKGLSAVDLARHLLKRFGSLQALLLAPHKDFCKEPGLGSAKYAQFQAGLELAKRHFHENIQLQNALENPEQTKQYLITRLGDCENEIFACLFLNTQNQIIDFKEISYGSLTQSNIAPREIVKWALKTNAANIIFAHNHPSGSLKPSDADINLTQTLSNLFLPLEIKVLDHIIIGRHKAISLAEQGYL